MSSSFFSLLLQAPAGGAPSVGPQVFIMVGMVVVMYFFMIRPQAKRAKEQKKFNAGVAQGDVVVTSAGIHGRIQRINDDGTMQLEVARGMVITVDRSAVSMEMTNALRKRADAALTGASSTTAAATTAAK
jgi:preprotein translocase subunit YajC